MEQKTVESLPKVELHCHLDGSVSKKTLRTIAKDQGYELPENEEVLRNLVEAGEGCQSLLDYIGKFETVLDCLQVESALEEVAYELIRDVAKENVTYIEVRFAPMLSTRKGLSAERVIQSVVEGLKKGEQDFDVKSNGILCMMRGHEEKDNLTIVELTREFLGKGIVGIDLAGDEANYPPKDYKKIIKLAVDYDLPITLHAGECGCAGNVQDSVDLGATRIGHGIALKDDPEILSYCISKGITVEICPNSNLQTKTVDKWENYPFEAFHQAGLKLAVSTDNRSVSDTNLTKEFITLDRLYQIGYEGMEELTLNGIHASFADATTKERLKKQVFESYGAVK